MLVRKLARAVVISAAAVALPSLPATAQVVTFSTSGAFSGAGCTASSCTFGGFTLAYTGVPSTSWLAPTNVFLGSFTTSCNACTAGTSAAIPVGTTFTLTVTQTAPITGTTSFKGSLGGALNWNPSGSSLVWTPSSASTQITNGPTDIETYAMIEQDQGAGPFGIVILSPTVANNPNATGVKANIAEQLTTIPEPATLVLTAIGLTALIPVGRRHRRASSR